MLILEPKFARIEHYSLPPSKMIMSCYMHTRVPSNTPMRHQLPSLPAKHTFFPESVCEGFFVKKQPL